jgi:hypothetical protein
MVVFLLFNIHDKYEDMNIPAVKEEYDLVLYNGVEGI